MRRPFWIIQGWGALQAITNSLERLRWSEMEQIHRVRSQCEGGGRDQSHGFKRSNAWDPQKLGEARAASPLEPLEGGNHFYCQLPSLW